MNLLRSIKFYAIRIIAIVILFLVATELFFTVAWWANAKCCYTPAILNTVALQEAEIDAEAVFDEMQTIGKPRYEPYALALKPEFSGDYVNINAQGERATAYNSTDDEALEIWVAGGSTVWGAGVADQKTIPSQLSLTMNSAYGIPTRVRNIGEVAYNSSQDLEAMLNTFRRGNQPDVVVFYNGANDLAFQLQFPNAVAPHTNFTGTGDIFEKRGVGAAVANRIRNLNTAKMIFAIQVRLGRSVDSSTPDAAPEDIEEVSKSVGLSAADIWAFNQSAVDSLGDKYSFTTLAVFQPWLAYPANAHGQEELDMLPGDTAKLAAIVMRDRIAELRASDNANFRYIDYSEVLAGGTDQYFFDAVHLGERGNANIGERLAFEVISSLCDEQGLTAEDKTATMDAVDAHCEDIVSP